MTTALSPARPQQPATAPQPRPGAVLAVLLLGLFMAILDVSIVNVAAPTLRSDLHASGAGLQLSIAGYTIAYAVLLITGARLGDRFGHGRAFRLGLAGFTLASLACGLAPTTAALVAFRFAQGTAAALMMPQIMSLIQRTFQGRERLRALSLYSAVIACGAVIGQVLGGVLVSADLFGTGWRPVFLVNVPIGAVLLVLAGRWLPRGTGDKSRQLDLPGVVTLSLAVLLFVVPLVLGHEEHWPAWGWVSLGLSGIALAAFVRVEQRINARGGSPLVSARVLRAPGLVLASASLFVAMITYSGYLFVMAMHLQGGLGESAQHAGLVFAPLAVGFATTSLTWSLLPQVLHARIVPVGLAVAAVAYAGLAVILRSGGSGGAPLELDLFVIGLALGFAMSPMISTALAHVPLSDAADASGVVTTVFQLGQVVGIAVLGTIYLSLVDGPGARVSAHGVTVTSVAIALACLLSATLATQVARIVHRAA